ncbi:MAG: hypothetical protein IH898_13080 [Planctomycetes bacterium]|nr:hypothetical protein [Planctomycetota bacterium]
MLALLLCALIGVGPTPAWAEELFDPPVPSAMADEILMMSTRAVGTVCDGKRLSEKLRCQRYEIGDNGRPHWKSMDWRDALQPASPTRTVVYVHGNRIAPGEDRYRGMMVYRSLVAQGRPSQPIRFIIWSWPATTIPGPIKDMRLKAARTCPVGWQLAWFLDQLPEETPVSLIGYSYGARVASGALHVLGGGRLNGLQLTERLHPQRPPIRVAMIAAAFDADWMLPGRYHGRAISQVEKLVLVTNHRDPVMRLFHFSVDRRRIHALGKEGVPHAQSLGKAARRIKPVDMTQEVGRSHLLVDYLAATGKMGVVWRRLIPSVEPSTDAAESSLAGSPSPSHR